FNPARDDMLVGESNAVGFESRQGRHIGMRIKCKTLVLQKTAKSLRDFFTIRQHGLLQSHVHWYGGEIEGAENFHGCVVISKAVFGDSACERFCEGIILLLFRKHEAFSMHAYSFKDEVFIKGK